MNATTELRADRAGAPGASSVRMLAIGETGKYINGVAFKPTDWSDEGLPIVRIQNLTDPTKPMNRTTRIVDPAYLVQPGDLLVSWSATLDAFIWDREPALLNQHIFKVVPNTELVSKKYLFFALRQAIVEMGRTEHLHGSTMKHINRGPFLAHRIRVPPLRVQAEIVAALEKQFSRLDEAVANLKRVGTRLTAYRERALDDSLAAEPNAALGELISEGPQNGLYLPKDAYGSGTPIVRIDDYQTDWIRPVGELRQVRATESQLSTWALQPGDLLVNRVNSMSHLGKCVVVPNVLADALFESNMMRFRVVPGVLPRYVELYLGSKIGKRRLTANAKWAVNQASINQKDVLATEIPLPSPEHQAQIVAELDRRLSIVREVTAEVDANLARSLGLRRSVLARAFAPSGALEALA